MVVEVGTAVLDALHLFEAADYLLAIDAMEAGDPPGSVYAFDTDAIADNGVPVSMHELSLVAALRFLPAHHPRPQIAVLGVEPETIEFGLDLTPPVQAALPLVLAEARRIVAQWLTEAGYDPAEVPQSSWLLVAE
jgi:hydrogenase maturation protease